MQEVTRDALELQLDGEAERFFSRPPGAWEVAHEEWQPEPLSSLERVAMLTTVAPGMAMLAVAITLLFTEALLTAAPPNVAEAVAHEQTLAVRPAVRDNAPVQAVREAPVVSVPVASAAPVAAVARPRSGKRPRSAVTRARQLLDAGRIGEARDLARSAIRSAPDKAGGYIVLAAALDKLGDHAGMKATFRSCVELAKDPLASACRSLAR